MPRNTPKITLEDGTSEEESCANLCEYLAGADGREDGSVGLPVSAMAHVSISRSVLEIWAERSRGSDPLSSEDGKDELCTASSHVWIASGSSNEKVERGNMLCFVLTYTCGCDEHMMMYAGRSDVTGVCTVCDLLFDKWSIELTASRIRDSTRRFVFFFHANKQSSWTYNKHTTRWRAWTLISWTNLQLFRTALINRIRY